MIGFTFDNEHCYDDYNVVMKSVDRSLVPILQKREVVIPGKHGSYDFGKNKYLNRFITVEISHQNTTYENLRTQIRQISQWLSKYDDYKKLWFDDETDVYYLARLYEPITLSNFFKLARTTLVFECQPFAYNQQSNAPVWGDDLIWNDNVQWDSLQGSSYKITDFSTTHTFTYNGTMKIDSSSPSNSEFLILIDGSFTSMSITMNGKTINYNEAISSETVTIDNTNMTVKKGTTNKLSACTGDLTEFLPLNVGENTIDISGSLLSCEVFIIFREQYL